MGKDTREGNITREVPGHSRPTSQAFLGFKEWMEAAGIVTSCKPTADYQVAGACSDLKPRKKMMKKNGKS